MNILNLPRKSIIYLLVCGAGLAAMSVVILYANYRTLAGLEKNISRMKAQIENQEYLYPVFQELFKKLQFKKPEGLDLPKPARLPRDETEKLMRLLQDLAIQNRFAVAGISPDVDSTIDGSKHLMVNMVLRGEFLRLQPFLAKLVEIPCFEHIEQIRVQSVKGTKEIQLRILLAKE